MAETNNNPTINTAKQIAEQQQQTEQNITKRACAMEVLAALQKERNYFVIMIVLTAISIISSSISNAVFFVVGVITVVFMLYVLYDIQPKIKQLSEKYGLTDWFK